jgi:hypothetical protein
MRAAGDCLEHLRRRVWPMAAARMPESSIIIAADEVVASHGTWIPDDLLMPLLRRIWHAAQRRGARIVPARPLANSESSDGRS